MNKRLTLFFEKNFGPSMSKIEQRILEPEAMSSLEEVAAYDKLARRYFKILHNGFVETVINHSPAAGNFLEVGTGTGWISIGIAKCTAKIKLTAVDLSETMQTVARKNALQEDVAERIEFFTCDAKRLPFQDGFFDCVCCHNMLHHIPDPLKVVKEMHRVAKKDGAILIRDLVRVPTFWIPFHVNLLGLPYNKLMKKEYRDSIKASLSYAEWEKLYQLSGIVGGRITKQFITHQGIEKAAKNRRRNYFKVPTPAFLKPFKNLYVSRLLDG